MQKAHACNNPTAVCLGFCSYSFPPSQFLERAPPQHHQQDSLAGRCLPALLYFLFFFVPCLGLLLPTNQNLSCLCSNKQWARRAQSGAQLHLPGPLLPHQERLLAHARSGAQPHRQVGRARATGEVPRVTDAALARGEPTVRYGC